MDRIKNLFHVMADAVFPRYCVRCGKERSLLCGPCLAEWQPSRPETIYFKEGEGLAALLSSFYYADPIVRALIGAWKYHFDQSAWRHLSQVFRLQDEAIRSVLRNGAMDAIVPVPLHRARLAERGFDQANLIAEALAEVGDIPVRELLVRARATGQQAERSDAERKQEMAESPFACKGNAPKRLLLVDDVWTTGATAQAAARTLINAGAQDVWIYTIARG